MFGRISSRIAALPVWGKVVLVLIALGFSVVLSPFVAVLAGLILVVAIFALILRLIRRRPLRNWGIAAVVALLSIFVFGGLANALYGGSPPRVRADRLGDPGDVLQDRPDRLPKELLGYANIIITLYTYSYVVPGMGDQTAREMEEALKEADPIEGEASEV